MGMKKKWAQRWPWFTPVLYAGIVLLSWIIVGVGDAARNSRMCKDLVPVIHNSASNQFLSVDQVKEIVKEAQGKPVTDCRLGDLSVSRIEYALRKNPFVRNADAYKDVSGRLVLDVHLRRPIARVMDMTGGGFYLDDKFRKVDLSPDFTSNTLLVRGEFYEPLTPRDTIRTRELAAMEQFLMFVHGDEFLRSQISEIVVNKAGEITLYPEVGDLVVHFGRPENIEKKFSNLMAFYTSVLNRVGWDKYASISLKFEGQIVATKRNYQ